MKQLLFLLLFPCLALAQYTGNAGQKITLGEQTTADGLVFRGVASIDTVTATSKITRANKQDTSAFILLDTVTNLLWHYKTGSNGWIQAGGSTFDTTTLNLTTRFAAKQNNITLTITGTSGAATFSPATATLNIPNYTVTNPVTGTGTTNYLPKFTGASTIGNSIIQDNGTNTSIGYTTNPSLYKLDVNGTGRFNGQLTINSISGDISGARNALYLKNNSSAGGQSNAIVFGSSATTKSWEILNDINADGSTINQLDFINQGAVKLTIPSTGAATFSNSVTAASFIAKGASSGYNILRRDNDIYAGGWYSPSGSILLDVQGIGTALTIAASTGAATFLNSVAVGNATAAPANGIVSNGEVWIGYTSDNGAYPLQVNGQIFATNATIATSDEKFKENITPLNKGLEIVNKLKPVTFNFISDTENNFSQYEEVGFIAQDVDRALSTETFSKSIVKAADDSEPTSTMGLATQNLIPILVKAIQEQNTLIKALEQRILILENK